MRAALLGSWALLAGAAAAGCDGGSEPPTAASAPAALPAPSFGCTFIDITAASGVAFRHVTGGTGEKLLPETLGSGVALLDYDRDGKLDAFFVASGPWPGKTPPSGPVPACALYRGGGNGTFADVTAATGTGLSLYGMGCAAADHDGDGDDDILVTGVGRCALLVQEGGVFRDQAASAGIGPGVWRDRAGVEHPAWSTAAAWADFDQDGDLDLLITSYVEWLPENEIFTTLDGTHKAFTTPDRYRGLPPRLYRGLGDGKLEDATAGSGLGELEGKALGVSLWDFDADGLVDFVVANDTRPNFFCRNRGGLRFEELGLASGIAYDETGRARAGMGIDIQDYANDGVPAVAIGNFSEEPMSLYRWEANGSFRSAAGPAGLAAATHSPLTFGVQFLDLDLDGWQDLVIANGHIEPDIALARPGQTHAQRPQILRGTPRGAFEDVSGLAGPDFARPLVGRGLAAGDWDGDGDADLVVTQNGGPAVLLRNDRQAATTANHYLAVRLRGRGKNTAALGATVRLTAGGVTQQRMVRTGSSYLSQSDLTAAFGLGTATRIESLTVRWPSGKEQAIPVDGVDRTLEVREE